MAGRKWSNTRPPLRFRAQNLRFPGVRGNCRATCGIGFTTGCKYPCSRVSARENISPELVSTNIAVAEHLSAIALHVETITLLQITVTFPGLAVLLLSLCFTVFSEGFLGTVAFLRNRNLASRGQARNRSTHQRNL